MIFQHQTSLIDFSIGNPKVHHVTDQKEFWRVRLPFIISCFYHNLKVCFINYEVIIFRNHNHLLMSCLKVYF